MVEGSCLEFEWTVLTMVVRINAADRQSGTEMIEAVMHWIWHVLKV